jgi:membrane protein
LRSIWNTCKKFGGHFFVRIEEDKLFSSSASLAYSTLLTLVPFFIVVFTIIKHIPWFHGMPEKIQRIILNNVVSNFASVLNEKLTEFLQHIDSLSSFNILVLFIFIILMMLNISQAFNHIWRKKMRYRYPIRVLIHVAVLIVAPLAFATLLFISPYLASLKYLVGDSVYTFVAQPVWLLLPFISSIFIFTVFNFFIPNSVVRFKYALLSGVFTAVLFLFAKRLFNWYVHFFNYNQLIYGALATIPLFLAWLFICWFIILSGALLCNILSIGLDNSIQRYTKK